MAIITIPAIMCKNFSGRSSIEVEGKNLIEAFTELDRQSPGFMKHILTLNQELKPFVRIYLDGKVVERNNLGEISLKEKSNVRILFSLAGG